MAKWISVLSSALFLFLFTSIGAKTIEPDQHRKAVESFKQEYKEFKMAMKRGESGTCSQLLQSLVKKAKAEWDLTKEKHQWFGTYKCNSIDQEAIAYQLKGRVTKQEEILAGLTGLSKKEVLDAQAMESAERYLQFLYDSMKENLEESETIADSCGL